MPESPKADLHRYLQAARGALLWKLDGLSEYDVRHNAGVGAEGTNDAIDYGPGAHQIMDEEEQRTVHVGGQWCCRPRSKPLCVKRRLGARRSSAVGAGVAWCSGPGVTCSEVPVFRVQPATLD
jgi:hypothetical protein